MKDIVNERKNVFKERIKELAKERHINQGQLANELNKYKGITTSEGSVKNWYRKGSDKTPDIITSSIIADILECDTDYLIGNINEHTHKMKNESCYSGLSSKALEHIKNLSQEKREVLEQIIMNCDDVLDDIVEYNNLQHNVDLEEKSATRSINSMPIYIKRDSSEKIEILKKNNVTYMSDYSTNDISFHYKDMNNEDTMLFIPNNHNIKIKLSYEIKKKSKYNFDTKQYEDEDSIIVEYIDKNNKKQKAIWSNNKGFKFKNIAINKLTFRDVNEDNVIDTNEGLNERIKNIADCEHGFITALRNAKYYADTSSKVTKYDIQTKSYNIINSILHKPKMTIYTDREIVDEIKHEIDQYRDLIEDAPKRKRERLSKKYGLQDEN